MYFNIGFSFYVYVLRESTSTLTLIGREHISRMTGTADF